MNRLITPNRARGLRREIRERHAELVQVRRGALAAIRAAKARAAETDNEWHLVCAREDWHGQYIMARHYYYSTIHHLASCDVRSFRWPANAERAAGARA